uniref:Uncharacterized protein n=1 Tax=Anguilla anguilla TaxID=7936 RepID=A0A0E9PG39_ANGAN
MHNTVCQMVWLYLTLTFPIRILGIVILYFKNHHLMMIIVCL